MEWPSLAIFTVLRDARHQFALAVNCYVGHVSYILRPHKSKGFKTFRVHGVHCTALNQVHFISISKKILCKNGKLPTEARIVYLSQEKSNKSYSVFICHVVLVFMKFFSNQISRFFLSNHRGAEKTEKKKICLENAVQAEGTVRLS